MTVQTQSGAHTPPERSSDEANQPQLDLARSQGESYGAALGTMVGEVATDGGSTTAGEYVVAWAVEHAEGMYEPRDAGLEWVEPGDANCHVEIAVRDGADGRFIPGLKVTATLIGPDRREVGTHEQPFLWHPWLYHYGRNWTVPADGSYGLRVRIEPPAFGRHDKENGRRFAEPVSVEFEDVHIETGRK